MQILSFIVIIVVFGIGTLALGYSVDAGCLAGDDIEERS